MYAVVTDSMECRACRSSRGGLQIDFAIVQYIYVSNAELMDETQTHDSGFEGMTIALPSGPKLDNTHPRATFPPNHRIYPI